MDLVFYFAGQDVSFPMEDIAWNAVSVDENVQSRSVLFASKCNCCINAQTESLNHLLLHGDLGLKIRAFFCHMLHRDVCGDVVDTISSW